MRGAADRRLQKKERIDAVQNVRETICAKRSETLIAEEEGRSFRRLFP